MNAKRVEEIAAAVLYEGYLLYPYRASALKNQHRWNFGVLYPRAYADQQPAGSSDSWSFHSECLLRAEPNAVLNVRVRFLRVATRPAVAEQAQQAVEDRILVPDFTLEDLASAPWRQGTVLRAEGGRPALPAVVELSAKRVSTSAFRLRIEICNASAYEASNRDEALLSSLVATHAIAGIEGGEFVSLLDPPDDLRPAAAACDNQGLWPVLVGEDGSKDAMLCSPIVLYDYPQIAPESAGALFDGTEIDEILSLRILTLTDEEKLAMQQGDERTREILRRTEAMPPEQFMKMHGALRGLRRTGQETQ